MSLLFSNLEHYNLLSKQPNYSCGLFLISAHSHTLSLGYSGEVWLLHITFPRLSRKHNNSETERERGQTGSPGQPRGEELPCRLLSHPVTLSWSGHVPAAPDRACRRKWNRTSLHLEAHSCRVSWNPWSMMHRKIKYLLLVSGKFNKKHFLLSGNFAFLSKHRPKMIM